MLFRILKMVTGQLVLTTQTSANQLDLISNHLSSALLKDLTTLTPQTHHPVFPNVLLPNTWSRNSKTVSVTLPTTTFLPTSLAWSTTSKKRTARNLNNNNNNPNNFNNNNNKPRLLVTKLNFVVLSRNTVTANTETSANSLTVPMICVHWTDIPSTRLNLAVHFTIPVFVLMVLVATSFTLLERCINRCHPPNPNSTPGLKVFPLVPLDQTLQVKCQAWTATPDQSNHNLLPVLQLLAAELMTMISFCPQLWEVDNSPWTNLHPCSQACPINPHPIPSSDVPPLPTKLWILSMNWPIVSPMLVCRGLHSMQYQKITKFIPHWNSFHTSISVVACIFLVYSVTSTNVTCNKYFLLSPINMSVPTNVLFIYHISTM